MDAIVKEMKNTGDLILLLPNGQSVRTSASMLLATTSNRTSMLNAMWSNDGVRYRVGSTRQGISIDMMQPSELVVLAWTVDVLMAPSFPHPFKGTPH